MLSFFKRTAATVTSPEEGYDTLFLDENGVLKFKNFQGNIRNAIDAVSQLIGQVNIFTKSQRSQIVPLAPSSGVYTPDFNAGNFFSFTPTGNFTLANPTNFPDNGVTQSGSFFITQDGTGGRAITFGDKYQASGGLSTIVLSSGANVKDRVDYVINPLGQIQVSVAKDIKS